MLESLLEAGRTAVEEDEELGLWEGRRVLDLYAGTGALGIEALSRGALAADFIESNPAACQAIRDNLAHTKLAPHGRVHCRAVRQFLRQWAHPAEGTDVMPAEGPAVMPAEGPAVRPAAYDLVLLDPPYAEPGLEDMLAQLASSGLLKAGGWLVVEHARRRPLPAEVEGLRQVKTRRHGDTAISIYSHHRPEERALAVGPGQTPGRQ